MGAVGVGGALCSFLSFITEIGSLRADALGRDPSGPPPTLRAEQWPAGYGCSEAGPQL